MRGGQGHFCKCATAFLMCWPQCCSWAAKLTSVRCANCRWAGSAKGVWKEGHVGSYTGGLAFKIFGKGSIVFELWCKASWLKISVRAPGQRTCLCMENIQDALSFGRLLLLPGSPPQMDGQEDWMWLFLSLWPSLRVSKLWRACGVLEVWCLVWWKRWEMPSFCATPLAVLPYKQLSDRVCQVRFHYPSSLFLIFKCIVANFKMKI